MEHPSGFGAARWAIPLFVVVAWGCSAPATGSDPKGGAQPGETAESLSFRDPFEGNHDHPRYGGQGELCRVEGRTACGERCVDLASDASNCGACGTRCAAGESCDEGACASATCAGGQPMCAGTCCAAGDTCVNGACSACGSGVACDNECCSEDDTCVGGHCTQISCGAGQPICNHACCAVGDACVNGVCTSACPGNVQACNGTCCASATDACVNGACSANACPNGCPTAFYCAFPGTCYPMCDHASGLCGGICCPNHEWLCNGSGVCCEYASCGDACCGEGHVCQNGVCTG